MSLKDEIKSVTSAWTMASAANFDPVDEKLLKSVSGRTYEAILQKAKESAMKTYFESFGMDLGPLMENHRNVEEKLGTENDIDGSWRINCEDISDEELERHIRLIRKKLQRVNAENTELTAGLEMKSAKLKCIQEQNERLEIMRDTQ